MSNAPTATVLVSGRDIPKNARPALCESCDLAYFYRGASAHPGCPSCGGVLSITTRALKRIGFRELAGAELAAAEVLPGGLPKHIAHHIARANDLAERHERAAAVRDHGAEGYEYDAANDIVWRLSPGYDGTIGRTAGEYVDGLAASALAENAKAEKLERRLAKISR